MRLATKPTDLDCIHRVWLGGGGQRHGCRSLVGDCGRFANGSVRKAGAGEDHEALRDERRPEEGGQLGRFTLGVVTGGPKVLMVLRAEPAPLGRRRPSNSRNAVSTLLPELQPAAKSNPTISTRATVLTVPGMPADPESAARPRRTSPTASRHRRPTRHRPRRSAPVLGSQAHSTYTSPISTSPRPSDTTRGFSSTTLPARRSVVGDGLGTDEDESRSCRPIPERHPCTWHSARCKSPSRRAAMSRCFGRRHGRPHSGPRRTGRDPDLLVLPAAPAPSPD